MRQQIGVDPALANGEDHRLDTLKNLPKSLGA